MKPWSPSILLLLGLLLGCRESETPVIRPSSAPQPATTRSAPIPSTPYNQGMDAPAFDPFPDFAFVFEDEYLVVDTEGTRYSLSGSAHWVTPYYASAKVSRSSLSQAYSSLIGKTFTIHSSSHGTRQVKIRGFEVLSFMESDESGDGSGAESSQETSDAAIPESDFWTKGNAHILVATTDPVESSQWTDGLSGPYIPDWASLSSRPEPVEWDCLSDSAASAEAADSIEVDPEYIALNDAYHLSLHQETAEGNPSRTDPAADWIDACNRHQSSFASGSSNALFYSLQSPDICSGDPFSGKRERLVVRLKKQTISFTPFPDLPVVALGLDDVFGIGKDGTILCILSDGLRVYALLRIHPDGTMESHVLRIPERPSSDGC